LILEEARGAAIALCNKNTKYLVLFSLKRDINNEKVCGILAYLMLDAVEHAVEGLVAGVTGQHGRQQVRLLVVGDGLTQDSTLDYCNQVYLNYLSCSLL